MGCILQMQRRAIEALRNVIRDESLPYIERGTLFLSEDQKHFFPLGISVGIGTCSDVHGMNVLVLDDKKPADERLWQQLKGDAVACEYAVLLLSPTEHERQNSTLCVERLQVLECTPQKVVLSKTGIRKQYANI